MTYMLRLVVVALSAAPLFGQDTATGRTAHPSCYHARPNPACSVFFLTNAGAYLNPSSPRALVDWGVMVNVGRRDAVGASFFAVGDSDGFAAGPAVRYRRWLRPQASLDAAVGTSIVVSHSIRNSPIKTGSLYGLVKWNPTHWFGIAARPELIRRRVAICGPVGCTFDTRSKAQLSFGVEFSWVPGLVLSVPGVLASAVAAALAGSN